MRYLLGVALTMISLAAVAESKAKSQPAPKAGVGHEMVNPGLGSDSSNSSQATNSERAPASDDQALKEIQTAIESRETLDDNSPE